MEYNSFYIAVNDSTIASNIKKKFWDNRDVILYKGAENISRVPSS